MAGERDWVAAYEELADIIATEVPDIKWVDLWMEQTSTEEDEYPFPTPAVFLDFSSESIDDIGENEQLLHTRITVMLALDNIAETNRGSKDKAKALRFMTIMRKLHKALHGLTGVSFSAMTRVSMRKEVAPPYVQLYSQTYATEILDTSTAKEFQEGIVGADRQLLTKGTTPPSPDAPLYTIPS